MRIKVNDKTYDSRKEPIFICFESKEEKNKILKIFMRDEYTILFVFYPNEEKYIANYHEDIGKIVNKWHIEELNEIGQLI